MINIGKSLCAAYKSTVQTDQAMNLLRHSPFFICLIRDAGPNMATGLL